MDKINSKISKIITDEDQISKKSIFPTMDISINWFTWKNTISDADILIASKDISNDYKKVKNLNKIIETSVLSSELASDILTNLHHSIHYNRKTWYSVEARTCLWRFKEMNLDWTNRTKLIWILVELYQDRAIKPEELSEYIEKNELPLEAILKYSNRFKIDPYPTAIKDLNQLANLKRYYYSDVLKTLDDNISSGEIKRVQISCIKKYLDNTEQYWINIPIEERIHIVNKLKTVLTWRAKDSTIVSIIEQFSKTDQWFSKELIEKSGMYDIYEKSCISNWTLTEILSWELSWACLKTITKKNLLEMLTDSLPYLSTSDVWNQGKDYFNKMIQSDEVDELKEFLVPLIKRKAIVLDDELLVGLSKFVSDEEISSIIGAAGNKLRSNELFPIKSYLLKNVSENIQSYLDSIVFEKFEESWIHCSILRHIVLNICKDDSLGNIVPSEFLIKYKQLFLTETKSIDSTISYSPSLAFRMVKEWIITKDEFNKRFPESSQDPQVVSWIDKTRYILNKPKAELTKEDIIYMFSIDDPESIKDFFDIKKFHWKSFLWEVDVYSSFLKYISYNRSLTIYMNSVYSENPLLKANLPNVEKLSKEICDSIWKKIPFMSIFRKVNRLRYPIDSIEFWKDEQFIRQMKTMLSSDKDPALNFLVGKNKDFIDLFINKDGTYDINQLWNLFWHIDMWSWQYSTLREGNSDIFNWLFEKIIDDIVINPTKLKYEILGTVLKKFITDTTIVVPNRNPDGKIWSSQMNFITEWNVNKLLSFLKTSGWAKSLWISPAELAYTNIKWLWHIISDDINWWKIKLLQNILDMIWEELVTALWKWYELNNSEQEIMLNHISNNAINTANGKMEMEWPAELFLMWVAGNTYWAAWKENFLHRNKETWEFPHIDDFISNVTYILNKDKILPEVLKNTIISKIVEPDPSLRGIRWVDNAMSQKILSKLVSKLDIITDEMMKIPKIASLVGESVKNIISKISTENIEEKETMILKLKEYLIQVKKIRQEWFIGFVKENVVDALTKTSTPTVKIVQILKKVLEEDDMKTLLKNLKN